MEMSNSVQSAPYAPAPNILKIIQRFRDRGLPDPVTGPVLEQIGIPSSSITRNLGALRYLGLIDDGGRRTETFDRLRRASTDEYPSVLAEIIRTAYEPIFTIVDPAEDDETAINDAFRHYEPAAQRSRMVLFFLALCREAGIVQDDKPARRAPQMRRAPSLRRQPSRQPDELKSEVQDSPRREFEDGGTDYRLISALFQQLPKGGSWSKKQRDRWMQAMEANLDLLVEVIDELAE